MNDRSLGNAVFGLMLSVLLAACGGGSGGAGGGTGNNDTNNTDTGSIVISTNGIGTIGANGGTITTPEGVSVMVPAGATTDSVTLRVAKDSTDAPSLPTLLPPISPVYEITPHIPQLSGLAQLKLPFDASKLKEGSTPQVVIVEPGGEWTVIEQAIVEGNVVTVPTNHFSYVYVGDPKMCTIPTGCGKSKNVPVVTRALKANYAPVELNANQWNRRIRVEQSTQFDLQLTVDPNSFVPEHFGNLYCTGSAELGVQVIGVRSTDPTQQVGHYFQRQYIKNDAPSFTASFPFEMTSADNGLYRIRIREHCPIGDLHSSIGCVGETCTGVYMDWIYMEVNIQAPPDAPRISQHPQGLTVVAGQAASFTAAGGADASQTIGWERSNNSGTIWSKVQAAANAQSSTYMLNSTVIADDGAWFRAEFCNSAGTKQTCVKSAIAELSVVPETAAPAFSRQPANVSVLAGQTASITVAAVGTHPPEIRIYRVEGAGVADSEVKICPAPGAGTVTACSYTTGALTESQSGMEFYARATNSAGSVDSSHAIVTVTRDAVAPVIVTQPSDVTTTVGGIANFRATTTGTSPMSYQWRFNGASLSDRAIATGTSGINGSNAATLNLGNVQLADIGAYTVVVSNSAGSVTSNEAKLAVSVEPPTSAAWTAELDDFGTETTGIAADNNDGSVYIVGTTEFDVGNKKNQGKSDVFLAKFDSAGTLLWTDMIGSSGWDEGNAVAVDSAHNVYIVGSTTGDLNEVPNIGNEDVFIAKYDKDGAHVWTKLLGTMVNEMPYAITIDAHDNIYVTGSTEGALESSEKPSSEVGSRHIFIARYDTAGAQQWIRQLWSLNVGGVDNAYIFATKSGITTDLSGDNVYVAGTINGVFDGTVSLGMSDAFLAKYSKEGTRQWIRQYGSQNSEDRANGVACDSAGNIYTTGSVAEDASPPQSLYENAFLAKHKPDGELQWTRVSGTASKYDIAVGAVVDDSDGVFIAGYTTGNLNGIPNAGLSDYFVIKYDTSGEAQWTQLWGTNEVEYCTVVGLSPAGGILVGGFGAADNHAVIHKFVSP